MKHAQRYIMIFFVIAAVVTAMILLPQVAQPAMRTPKGTIVIDAGHGGFDGGASGKSGIHEDGLNLAVAQKLEALFEKNGYIVIMTRETGEAIGDTKDKDMAARRKIIAEAKADIVISIHMNKFSDTSVCGPQVFYHEDSAEGEKFAKLIQQELNTALEPPKDRIEHPEDYFILCSGDSPAVIVECGFLSNEREEALLQDDTYQMECAKAIYRGADAYLDQRVQSEDTGDFHYPL